MTDLVQQRSMLVILHAACTAAKTAFDAAGNEIDSELRKDLATMIKRTENELEALQHKIEEAGL